MPRDYLEHNLFSAQHILEITQSSCQGINNSGKSIAVVLLNRWSDDVGVSRLPAAKADGKINITAQA